MTPLRLLTLGLPALFLAACETAEIDALDAADVSGPAFNKQLANDYKGFVQYESKVMYDYPDARHFARKGLAASSGQSVQPEDPKNWSIKEKAALQELESERSRLMTALANGAAAKSPAAAARAQVSYDCWVEQQEEGWQYDDIAGCKAGFMKAMQVVNASLEARPQASAAPAVAQPNLAAAPRDYLIFFDWDKAVIRSDAREILRLMAADARKATGPVTLGIFGHADRSGSADYNKGLSMRRAQAVRDALAEDGLPRDAMVLRAEGESEPLVVTGDGVREPQNRRVQVTISTAGAGA